MHIVGTAHTKEVHEILKHVDWWAEKIAEGLICIGKPPMRDGGQLFTDEEGRYHIEYDD